MDYYDSPVLLVVMDGAHQVSRPDNLNITTYDTPPLILPRIYLTEELLSL